MKLRAHTDSRLRVFVISGYLGNTGAGGAAKAAWLLAKEMANLGCEVKAFSPQGLLAGSDQLPEKAKVVSSFFKRGCRWKLPERMLVWRVYLAAFRERPAVIFVVGMTSLTRRLLGFRFSSPVVIWETTMANPGNKFIDRQAAQLLSRSRAILSPSCIVDNNIRKTYGYKGPIVRLPFWIEEDKIEPADRETDSAGGFDFLYLGRKDKDKGIEELLCAICELIKKRPQTKSVVCGPGSDELFIKIAKRMGIDSVVEFTYLPDPRDLPLLIRRCRWLILPSRHEGYPLVLLAAAQHGCPFIATRVGSIPELFEDSKAAVLVSPRDPNALADAMSRVIGEDRSIYMDRKCAAQREFQRLSSPQVVRQNLEKALEAVLRK